MPRVICKLPNASRLISGVAFEERDGAMLSEDIGEEAAAVFASIPGYEMAEEEAAPANPEEDKTEAKRPRGRATSKSDD